MLVVNHIGVEPIRIKARRRGDLIQSRNLAIAQLHGGRAENFIIGIDQQRREPPTDGATRAREKNL